MTPGERLSKIEGIIEQQNAQIDKQNDGIRNLIVVARTCLDSIQEMRETHREDHKQLIVEIKELRDAQSVTDEKLNILIDTVDRIIRRGDYHEIRGQ